MQQQGGRWWRLQHQHLHPAGSPVLLRAVSPGFGRYLMPAEE